MVWQSYLGKAHEVLIHLLRTQSLPQIVSSLFRNSVFALFFGRWHQVASSIDWISRWCNLVLLYLPRTLSSVSSLLSVCCRSWVQCSATQFLHFSLEDVTRQHHRLIESVDDVIFVVGPSGQSAQHLTDLYHYGCSINWLNQLMRWS